MGVKSSAKKVIRRAKDSSLDGPTGELLGRQGIAPPGKAGPGRPTPAEDDLTRRRNALAYLLETRWGEIGWQLECARSKEDIQAASQRIVGGTHEYLVAALARDSTEAATSASIRSTKKELGKALSEYLQAERRLNAPRQSVEDAERAVFELSDQNRDQLGAELSRRKANVRKLKSRVSNQKKQIREKALTLRNSMRDSREALQVELNLLQAGLAKTEREYSEERRIVEQVRERLDKISPERRKAVAEILSQRNTLLAAMEADVLKVKSQRERVEKKLLDKEAYFCQVELLRFIREKRYGFNPLNLANAIAGLPDMAYRRSAVRCEKLPPWEPSLLYRVFEFVERTWRLRAPRNFSSPVELFRTAITKLPKTVLIRGVGRRQNHFRRYLEENWVYFKRAIEAGLRSKPHPHQFPYVVTQNFAKNLAEPKTAADLLFAQQESLTSS